MSQIVSPKTGRLIKVGSKTYNDLLKDPRYRDTLLDPTAPEKLVGLTEGRVATSGLPPLHSSPRASSKAAKSVNFAGSPKSPSSSLRSVKMPLYNIPSLEETLAKTGQPSKQAKLEQMIGREDEGRGIKTRGWLGRSPSRGRERHQLMAECGEKCFLHPEGEKFPICPSPRITGGKSVCEADCGGVQAAKIRARQYKYHDVAAKADVLLEKCNAKGLDAFLPAGAPGKTVPQLPALSSKVSASRSATRAGKMDKYGVGLRHARRAGRRTAAVLMGYDQEDPENPERELNGDDTRVDEEDTEPEEMSYENWRKYNDYTRSRKSDNYNQDDNDETYTYENEGHRHDVRSYGWKKYDHPVGEKHDCGCGN